ncbi:MAG: hypothetical protein M3457_14680 [Chloroflexota bacterium]|nr:hypothetical protein [Chloroflexota bacterium]
MTDNNGDPNQDAANQVKQRGTDATVDLGEEPSGERKPAVEQEEGDPKEYSGDVRDTVNDDVEESSREP